MAERRMEEAENTFKETVVVQAVPWYDELWRKVVLRWRMVGYSLLLEVEVVL